MKINSMRVMAGLIATVLLSGMAAAQTSEELLVTGSRFVEKRVGTDRVGIPIMDVSMTFHVNLADLNFASPAAAAEIERRVALAARRACRELGIMYPVSYPNDAVCARAAVEKSMNQLRQLTASTQ
jgi:UrcA family protein